jgi:hypothetical protein
LPSLPLDFTIDMIKQPGVVQQIISRLDRNEWLEKLVVQPFPRAALEQMWKTLGTDGCSPRVLKLGLNFSTCDNEVLHGGDGASNESTANDNNDPRNTSSRNKDSILKSGEDREFETGLATLLRSKKTILANCRLEKYMGGDLNKACFSADLCGEINYYLNLNGYGRKEASDSDCSNHTLVKLARSSHRHPHSKGSRRLCDWPMFLGAPLI